MFLPGTGLFPLNILHISKWGCFGLHLFHLQKICLFLGFKTNIMNNNRRDFLKTATLAAAGAGMAAAVPGCVPKTTVEEPVRSIGRSSNRIGVSTYSFWQFNGPKENVPIEMCIENAAEMGFDGIEFLLMQMTSEENSYLQMLKRKAFHAGLDIMGFSTHQGFVFPDKKTTSKTLRSHT